MPVFDVELIQKEYIAEGTMAFHFKKPADFNYQAGQYAYYILPGAKGDDDRDKVHHFTLTYAPFESELVFTTRLRNSVFKNTMKELPIGSMIKFDGAEGNFILKDFNKIAVFITGGIGITTARSMIPQAFHDGFSKDIILFSSDNTPEEMPFDQFFCDLQKSNSNFAYISIFTDVSGHINMTVIDKFIPDLNNATYYISGSSDFVDSIANMLKSNNVKRHNIVTEKFPGY